MNKEDIWVSKIPVPVKDKVTADVNDIFNDLPDNKELDEWNIYSPLYCHVSMVKLNDQKELALHDSDPFDYAKAERVIPESKKLTATFEITALQNNFGNMGDRNAGCKRYSLPAINVGLHWQHSYQTGISQQKPGNL